MPSPTTNPTICCGIVADFGVYVQSYFDNYIYYKLQKSLDNGLNWTDASTVNTGSPVWNGNAYEYFTAYPSFVATMADSGTKFRVVVASTLSNISNTNCAFANVASVLTLNVIDRSIP